MRLPVDQKVVGEIPKEYITNFLSVIEESDWFVDDYRNNLKKMVSTNSIPLMHSYLCGTDESMKTIRTIEKRKLYSKYEHVLLPIIEHLKKFYEFKFYAAFVARLNPRSTIGMHGDRGKFLELCHRVHVPLKSNNQVEYIIEDKKYYWQPGFVYEFDNIRPHMVVNKSSEERIHLVINLYNLSEEDLQRLEQEE